MTNSSNAPHLIVATDEVKILSRSTTPGQKFRDGFERRIIHTDKLMTVVIDIDNGPWAEADPLHSHPHEQTTYIAEGELMFLCQGRAPERLGAGDIYATPPDVPHSIQLLSKTARLVDSFAPIREDFLPQS